LVAKKVIEFRNAIDKDMKTNQLGNQLYQQLLKKALAELPTTILGNNQIDNLIIIPDGILSALPFEALQKTNEEHNYLLNNYTISYDLHSSFLKNSIDNTSFNKISVAGFSVKDFSNWGDEWVNLPDSEREIENLKNFMNKEEIRHLEQSPKQQFLKNISDYQIVHISTHAMADTLNAANSRIIFSRNNDHESDDMLTRDEILNHKCPAEMVVLSACETGIGKHNRGEGIASLARAFRTIGSKSEVMSLWNIYDGSTSEIMIEFYKNLKAGLPKNEALSKAKLNYLKTAKNKHPKLWAGLVLQGNVNQLY